ncbi:hypothetical protein OKW49_004203 [Paraburkholderia youngii]|uniref:hypothetical protein n=1 Tax=Paraburkholderia youngii TaxID=2782701 RepID=UPI003D1983D7
MEPLTCDYVPPYVRAEADKTKYPVEVKICGEYYRLPPTEMPGEKAWYSDFKQLIISMYIAWFCSMTRDQWVENDNYLGRSFDHYLGRW